MLWSLIAAHVCRPALARDTPPAPAFFEALEAGTVVSAGTDPAAPLAVVQRVAVRGSPSEWYLMITSGKGALDADIARVLGGVKSTRSYDLVVGDKLTGTGKRCGGLFAEDLFLTVPTPHRLVAEWVWDDAATKMSGKFMALSERLLNIGTGALPYPTSSKECKAVDSARGASEPEGARWYNLLSGAALRYGAALGVNSMLRPGSP